MKLKNKVKKIQVTEQEIYNESDSLCEVLNELKLDVHVNGKHGNGLVMERCLIMCRELSEWINDIDNGLERVRSVGHVGA